MFPLDLNLTYHEIHESMNFETWEVRSAFSLSCSLDAPQHSKKPRRALKKSLFFLLFYSRRHTVKLNTALGQVLPWFCAEVPIHPKDSAHFKYTSTVACAGQKIFYKAVLQMNVVLVVFLGCLRSLFPRPC